MAIAISSAGVKVYYIAAANTSAPTGQTGFTEIPDVKSIPSLSPSPDTLETTPLANTEYKTYINGLKDLGGALEFTVNLSDELLELWNGPRTGDNSDKKSVMEEFEGLADGQSLWLAVVHPKLSQAVYFPFEPAKLGLPEISVNEVLEGTLSITPTGEVVWGAKSSDFTNA